MSLELREEVQAGRRHLAVIMKPGFMKPWSWRRFSRERRRTENKKNKRQSTETL